MRSVFVYLGSVLFINVICFGQARASDVNCHALFRTRIAAIEGYESLMDLNNKYMQEIKSKDDIYSYFSCYLALPRLPQPKNDPKAKGPIKKNYESLSTEPETFDIFLEKYVPPFEADSRCFDAPLEITACTVFRESKFDEKATNKDSNAEGMAQLLPPAMNDINDQIDDNPDFKNQWQACFRERGLKAPEHLARKMGYNHEIAIATNAAYIHRLIEYVDKTLTKYGIPKNLTFLDISTMIAIAYNMGPTAFDQAWGQYVRNTNGRLVHETALVNQSEIKKSQKDKKPVPPKIAWWQDPSFHVTTEARNYAISQRNCMKKDHWDPPVGFKPGDRECKILQARK
jgi:hypothetical protein